MSNHYLCLAISPVNGTQLKSDTNIDVLTIRKALQDALAELFGVTTAGTYIDVLAVTKFTASPTLSSTDAAVGDRRRPWGEVVLRVHPSRPKPTFFTTSTTMKSIIIHSTRSHVSYYTDRPTVVEARNDVPMHQDTSTLPRPVPPPTSPAPPRYPGSTRDPPLFPDPRPTPLPLPLPTSPPRSRS
ncbi:hypothetical protein J3A83DRAFT_4368818 [Scleroderma citrinum]